MQSILERIGWALYHQDILAGPELILKWKMKLLFKSMARILKANAIYSYIVLKQEKKVD